MKLEYDKSIKHLKLDDGDLVNLSGHQPHSANHILIDKIGCKVHYVDEQRLFITSDDLVKYFDPIDDFAQIYFSKTLGQFVSYTEVYKSKKYDFFICIDINLQETSFIDNFELDEIIVPNTYKIINIYYKAEDKKSCDRIINFLNKIIKNKYNDDSKMSIIIKTNYGVSFKECKIKPLPIDIDKMYDNSFMDVHNHIVYSLKNTNKGVVMLHGKAGTGKSNYIKHLTTIITDKRFIFVPINMIESLIDPSFISKLIDNQNSILILEDCETYLKDRDVTDNNIVSIILNLSDGILSDILGVQVICTFNSNLSKIDDALLRSGRLIAEYEFNPLPINKVNTIIKDLGLDYIADKPMILSDIYNIKNKIHRTNKNKTNKIGF